MGKIKNWIKENVIITIIAVIVLIYVSKLGIEFSSAPAFCQMLCHNMKQDVAAWKRSYHGSGNNGKPVERHGHKANCHACHYDPGVFGFIRGKMAALVQVAHELTGNRGHKLSETSEEDKKHLLPQYIHDPKDWGGGKDEDVFWTSLHGEKRQITYRACKRCHPDKTGMVNLNALLSAKKDVGRDPKARNPEKEAKANVLTVERFKAVPGPHASHEDKGLICLDCHMEIIHAPESLGIGPYNLPRMQICFRCHDGEKAFRDTCERCHIGQVSMHAGVGAKDVEDSPGLMFENAECGDCGHSEGNNFRPDISLCDGCHDEGQQDYVIEWQGDYKVAVAPVKRLIKDVEKLLKKAGKKHSSEIAEAEELFNIAQYNYDYAVKDGSRGAHNNEYTLAMLEKSKENLEAAKSLLSKKQTKKKKH